MYRETEDIPEILVAVYVKCTSRLCTYRRSISSSLVMPACLRISVSVPCGKSLLWYGTTVLRFVSGW